MKIIVFGSVNIDHVYYVPHIIKPEESLHVLGTETFLGGKGLNQAIACAKAGAVTWLAGCCGFEDGQGFFDVCADYNINTSLLQQLPGKSGETLIQVDPYGQNSILVLGHANQQNTPQRIAQVMSQCDQGDIIVVQNELNGLPDIIRQACRKQCKVILNPSPMDSDLASLDLSLVTGLLLNEVEISALTGEWDMLMALKKLKCTYPELLAILTIGEKGSMVLEGENLLHVPADNTGPIADTTGAGDTYLGYFICAYYAEGQSVRSAMELASKAASIAIGRAGATQSIPMRKELADLPSK